MTKFFSRRIQQISKSKIRSDHQKDKSIIIENNSVHRSSMNSAQDSISLEQKLFSDSPSLHLIRKDFKNSYDDFIQPSNIIEQQEMIQGEKSFRNDKVIDNGRQFQQPSRKIDLIDSELELEFAKTEKNLHRLKQQRDFLKNRNRLQQAGGGYHSRGLHSIQYEYFREKFKSSPLTILHSLNPPDEKRIHTPNNYKRFSEDFFEKKENLRDRITHSLDTTNPNIQESQRQYILEEKNLIGRIQRDIDRQKLILLSQSKESSKIQNGNQHLPPNFEHKDKINVLSHFEGIYQMNSLLKNDQKQAKQTQSAQVSPINTPPKFKEQENQIIFPFTQRSDYSNKPFHSRKQMFYRNQNIDEYNQKENIHFNDQYHLFSRRQQINEINLLADDDDDYNNNQFKRQNSSQKNQQVCIQKERQYDKTELKWNDQTIKSYPHQNPRIENPNFTRNKGIMKDQFHRNFYNGDLQSQYSSPFAISTVGIPLKESRSNLRDENISINNQKLKQQNGAKRNESFDEKYVIDCSTLKNQNVHSEKKKSQSNNIINKQNINKFLIKNEMKKQDYSQLGENSKSFCKDRSDLNACGEIPGEKIECYTYDHQHQNQKRNANNYQHQLLTRTKSTTITSSEIPTFPNLQNQSNNKLKPILFPSNQTNNVFKQQNNFQSKEIKRRVNSNPQKNPSRPNIYTFNGQNQYPSY